MIRFLVVLLFFIQAACIEAQNIDVGSKLTIYSNLLQENREIWVSLPQNYNDTVYAPSSYPVMYLLDPDLYFLPMVAVRNALTGSHYSYMPEMIIVGIVNTDRTRDFTPTNSFIIHSGQKIYESSGGAIKFTDFITNELMPFIDSTYRTNGYKILNGHSFGGLYALNLLMDQPKLFNAYLVHDPSLWWDDKVVYKKAIKKWTNLDLKGITLFLSKANNDTTMDDSLKHSSTIDAFYKNVLLSKPKNGFRYTFSYFDKENHGTIFLPATYSAMKYLYKGFCLPVKKIPLHPGIIEKQFKEVSDSLGFGQTAEEHIIDNIGNYCMSTGELDSALKIFEINLKNYPHSPHTYISLAKLYAKKVDWTKALYYYNIAIALNPEYKVTYNDLINFRK